MKLKSSLILSLWAALFLSSCVSQNEIRYIQETEGSSSQEKYENVRTQKKIESYDKLFIKVYNIDPNVNALFQESGMYSQNISLISYSVDENGYITFPFIGKIKVAGLTIEDARQKLEQELNNYLPNTSITLRYVGNVITVLGEVFRQGEYPFYDDKINIFQALSYAGGINDYGNKSNIKIIREVNNEITFFELNLNKKEVVENPQYYLNPNDIVVVSPINAKYRTYGDFALYTLVLTSVSTIILIINTLNTYQLLK